jgi:hypothetical protein
MLADGMELHDTVEDLDLPLPSIVDLEGEFGTEIDRVNSGNGDGESAGGGRDVGAELASMADGPVRGEQLEVARPFEDDSGTADEFDLDQSARQPKAAWCEGRAVID